MATKTYSFVIGKCAVCGENTALQKRGKYWKCYTCWRMGYTPKRNPYIKVKKGEG
jgi:hypothetical protein